MASSLSGVGRAEAARLPGVPCRAVALCRALGLLAALVCGVWGSWGSGEFGAPASAWAASALSAPQTGLEGSQRHTFGPDAEGKRDPRAMTAAPLDAYGNPVVPREEEEVVRNRPRPGAYGTRPAPRARPLPDAPQEDAGWKFR